MTVQIEVRASSLSFGAQGLITGDIALVIDDRVFPSVGWNDFVVVILEALLSALVRLSRDKARGEIVHFMEGPYEVRLARSAGGMLELRAIERPSRLHATTEVDAGAFRAEAIQAANAAIDACHGASHTSSDLNRLVATAEDLRKEIRGHEDRKKQ